MAQGGRLSDLPSERLILATRLRQARRAAYLTQAALAERLGKPQSFVAKYELGDRALRMHEFYKVTDALGIDPVPVMQKAYEESSSPSDDLIIPPRLRVEELFWIMRALAADAGLLVKLSIDRTGRTPVREAANAWLQAKWPRPHARRKTALDHPWRK